jgi:hypothetical protein
MVRRHLALSLSMGEKVRKLSIITPLLVLLWLTGRNCLFHTCWKKTIENKNNSKLRNLKSHQTAVQHSNSPTSDAFSEPTHDILFEKKYEKF